RSALARQRARRRSCKGEDPMSFIDSVRRAQTLLQEEQRISLRALRRELDLDADAMDALVAELVEIRGVAVRDGKAVAWANPVNPPESRIGPPPTEGQRRQLTVLFCDLVGSTELAAQMDPEDWSTVAAAYQRAAAAVVERFGGHVAKYLGDGLLVYFGYPRAHEDDVERAARAGLALVNAVQHLDDPRAVPTADDGARSPVRSL